MTYARLSRITTVLSQSANARLVRQVSDSAPMFLPLFTFLPHISHSLLTESTCLVFFCSGFTGTCRVGLKCFCPLNFLSGYEERASEGTWTECEASFSENWPESNGKEDVDWRSCKKQDPVTNTVSNPSVTATSGGETDSGTNGDDETSAGGGTSNEDKSASEDEDGGINWDKVTTFHTRHSLLQLQVLMTMVKSCMC